MLNYLGPNIGPSPVSATLPSGPPGTMPAGVPGAPSANPIWPNLPPNITGPQAGAISPAGPSGPPPAAPDDPSSLQYETLTQQDGTVVLFMKNPDGSRGPAVKIISVKAPASSSAK